MKGSRLFRLILLLALSSAARGVTVLHAAEADPKEAAITKTAEAFVEAFHKGDAKALSEFWTVDGDYVDDTGRVLKGREAIEKSFAELFAHNKGLKLRIEVASIEFPTPDLAIEDGTTAVLATDGSAPSRARYTNVLVKKDGQWLLSSVREAAYAPPSNYEVLRPLEWTIGEWVDEGNDGVVNRIAFEWGPGQNFIIVTRTVEHKDATLNNGTQWIGWDPVTKQIRSWSFEADGGFGEAVWTKEGDKWVVKSTSTVADGRKITATHHITPVDGETISVQSKDQSLNGEPLPDTKEIKMKRVD